MEGWHTQTVQQLYQQFESSSEGLSDAQARQRLEKFGRNELHQPKQAGIAQRILAQLCDPMILVLLGAAGLSWMASRGEDWLDAVIILIIVAVNGILSITQEDHAQQALDELRKLSAPKAHVIRKGILHTVPAAELIPGDVIALEAGDQVPADARIIQCSRLQADESALTGESLPVEKQVSERLDSDTPLGERSNILLSGTWVTTGRGTALVVATGMNTEMGKIAGLLLKSERMDTPIQEKMEEISKVLSILCLGICVVMFGVGLYSGKPLLDMLLTAVSLAVAAIPEGLPAVVTIVLALGVQRMAGRGAIVKKLPAVETLGCAGVICSDKTGTLTQNRMTVQQIWVLNQSERPQALMAGTLCSDAYFTETGTVVGDPTEAALVVAATKEGMVQEELQEQWKRTGDIPFDSNRKRMSTIHINPAGGWVVFVKGAPDVLLERCEGLSQEQRQRIVRMNEEMANKALRVIAVARRELNLLPAGLNPDAVEQHLTFLGLFGLMDPPRPEAKVAVERCHCAGIRPIMITGDHRATAVAVAKQLGILSPGTKTMTGGELDFLPQSVLEQDITQFSVYARVTPEHKLRIIKAWQKQGQVVAMSGDGVNDAPALKAADIGCAMGRSGTEVAKGAAHMILTDDNFSTIVQAVEEGRGIYANIRKAIHYLLSCNIGEILTIFVATILNFAQMPLVPVQLLWLNLVTDSLPALALGLEPVEDDVMEHPPRRKEEPLFDKAFTIRLVWQGAMVGGVTLIAYLLGLRDSSGAANTMSFAALTLSQLVHAFNVRSEHHSLFTLGICSNPAMNRAFLVGLVLQLAVLLVPPLQGVFCVVSLSKIQWIYVVLLALAPIPICELSKLYCKFRS